MANYATLKAAIAAAIQQNGNNEITGNLLQQQLLAMVNSLGVGYQYAGIATPATNPGTPDQNVFYLASTAGTYTNFGGLVLDDGEIAILKYNGAWSKDSTGAATQESTNKLGQEMIYNATGIAKSKDFDGWPGISGGVGYIVHNGGTFKVLSVKVGDIVNVTANNNFLGIISVAQSFDNDNFVVATDFPDRIMIQQGQTQSITITQDANYLLISNKLNGNVYLPKSIKVNNIEIIGDVRGDIASLQSNVNAIDANVNAIDARVLANEQKIANLKITELIQSDFCELVNPTQVSYIQNRLIKRDGTIATDVGQNWVMWEINNNLSTNDNLYVRAEIGDWGLPYRTYINVGLYDSNDNFIEGINTTGTKIIRVPYSCILRICANIARTPNANVTYSLNVTFSDISTIKPKVSQVVTWGDSITEQGFYQKGIAQGLGIAENKVLNYGLSSDYSMHVRRRFISFYTEETPYKGTATYVVPTLAERQAQLTNSFFVIWIGTNNLLRYNREPGPWTTGSDAFMALQPNPDFKYDRLFAKSYLSMMLNDIRLMTSLLPKRNFVIIGGHSNFESKSDVMYPAMIEFDKLAQRIFPNNYVDIRELVIMENNYQYTFLVTDFVKPAQGGSVTFEITDTSWIGDTHNPSSDICIGTKEIYDRYRVTNVSGNIVTATLIQSNSEFAEGDTIRASYNLVSDMGRDAVTMRTGVFSLEDVIKFGILEYPRNSSDPIHFTEEQYIVIGNLIAKYIQQNP